ncbi:MAG: hypothetical protein JWM62_414 [Frankiales bacterium]|nr:hypothetical protein [Frankiales bacterium]
MRRRCVGLLVALLSGAAVVAGLPAGAAGPSGSAPAADPLPYLPIVNPSPTPKPKPPPPPPPKPKPAPPTAAPADRWALVVGVTNYRGNVKDTRAGAADARLVRDVLLRHGWRSDRIRILTDDQATGRAVADGISWLQKNSSSKTFSFFHYSGHVKQKNGHEFLWPVDNAYIQDTEVSRVLKAVRGTAWTSISGCEAGGFDEGLSSSRHLFTASSHVTEKSYEDTKTGYSVWTGMLFAEGLRDKKADADGDGGVSVNEALQYAGPRAKTYTRNQRPHGPQTPEWRGGNGSLNLAAPRI